MTIGGTIIAHDFIMTGVTETSACRSCCSKTDTVLDWGLCSMANNYLATKDEPELTVPLVVDLCQACGLVQLRYVVDPKIIYNNYLYASSESGSLKRHFIEYAADAAAILKLKFGSVIVGIGGNDGPLELAFQELGFPVLNVEPCATLAAKARRNGIPTIHKWFNEDTAKAIVETDGHADVITCNNCFAHMPDLHSVVKGMDILLAKDGTIIIESEYLMDTINGLHVGKFYHEHVFYWTAFSLTKLFGKYGMHIYYWQTSNADKGMFRAFIRRGNDRSYGVLAVMGREQHVGVLDPFTYKSFRNHVSKWQDRALSFFNSIHGNRIACYGAPAKFMLMSKLLALSGKVDYAVEDMPQKVGLYTPGEHIPIVNRQRFVDDPPDICLISATNYAKLVIERNPQFKGRWVQMLPEMKDVSLNEL